MMKAFQGKCHHCGHDHDEQSAPRPAEGAIDEGAVESLAQEIYKRIPFDSPSDGFTSKPAWIVGGNSIRQDDARTYARTAIKFLSAAAIGTGGQWISVDDRLPPTDVHVWVDGGVAVWRGGHWDSMMTMRAIEWEVTHWCPLPSPPSQRGGDIVQGDKT